MPANRNSLEASKVPAAVGSYDGGLKKVSGEPRHQSALGAPISGDLNARHDNDYTNGTPLAAKPLPAKPIAKERGLTAHPCECGATVWAFPWSDELVAWDCHQRPLKSFLDAKGLAPPEPRSSHHVVFADAPDADLLRSRRWRVYPSKVRTRHKAEVRGGTGRGLRLRTSDQPQRVRLSPGEPCPHDA